MYAMTRLVGKTRTDHGETCVGYCTVYCKYDGVDPPASVCPRVPLALRNLHEASPVALGDLPLAIEGEL